MKKFVINSTSILKLYIGSHHFMRENIKRWLLFFLLTVYKSSHPPVLAQRWMTGLRTRPKNEHKSEAKASRYANAWEGLRECEARSNPVSKKCSGKRLEKGLRECEARSNPISKNVVGKGLRRIAGVKFDNNGQTGLHKTRKQYYYRIAYPKYLKIVNF